MMYASTNLAMIGAPEAMVIIAVVLVLFGAKKVPELAKGFGQGLREFKKATREINDDIRQALEEEPPPPPRRSDDQPHWTDKTVDKAAEVKE
jgi:sec-independent protein translocase protein TatA